MTVTQIVSYVITGAIPLLAVYILSTLDMFGTGKITTIFASFAWGLLGAFGLAYLINTYVLRGALGMSYDNLVRIGAPIVEELLKASILVVLISRPRFRYSVDGAIYGFAVGIGFSVSENIFYLNLARGSEANLTLAISRVLSTALMHATTSAIVGISLGRLRRAQGPALVATAIAGLLLAIAVHAGYNNIVNTLQGIPLLLVAIAIGMGGSAFVGYQINLALKDEKKRFEKVLNSTSSGITSSEVRALQSMGEDKIELVLFEIGSIFGERYQPIVRRLFALQANIGILKNNLSNPCPDHLRKAWEHEISQARTEIDALREKNLGVMIMSYLRGVFPDENAQNDYAQAFREQLAISDPTHVHKFDLFILGSVKANTYSPEQLEAMAAILKEAPFFEDVSLADLQNLSRSITHRDFDPGEVLWAKNAPGDFMYMIETGQIETVDVHHGLEKRVNVLTRGSSVGELALLDGLPRSLTARAVTPVHVLMIRRDNFGTFVHSRPNVVMAILKYLTGRVRFNTKRIEDYATVANHVIRGDIDGVKQADLDIELSTLLQLTPAPEAPVPVEERRSVIASFSEQRGAAPDASAALDGIFARASIKLDARAIEEMSELEDRHSGRLSGLFRSSSLHDKDKPDQQQSKPQVGHGLFDRAIALDVALDAPLANDGKHNDAEAGEDVTPEKRGEDGR